MILFIGAVVSNGCMAPHISVSECEAMCARQGREVRLYKIGSVVPIFKPRPPVVCECGE